MKDSNKSVQNDLPTLRKEENLKVIYLIFNSEKFSVCVSCSKKSVECQLFFNEA